MSNTILTPTVINNELLRRFENNLGFGAVVHTEDYSEHFGQKGAKIGDTLALRDPVRLAATDGATLVIQDVEERKIPLVIDTRKHTGFAFTSAEETLSIDRIGDRYLQSSAVALSNAVELSGLTMAYRQTPNVVGTPGTTPSTFLTYMTAGEALDRNSAPMDGDRFMVIPSKFQSAIVDALKGLFASTEQIKRQYVKGRMGTAAGFDWIMAQNVRTHTIGAITGGSPQVDGAGQTGSTLNIKNLTASSPAFKAGDILTQAATYAVNAVSGDVLSDLRQFTILNDANTDANGKASLNIYPPMSVIGDTQHPNPYATISATMTDGAALVCFGAANTLTPQGLAFHKEAFAWACPQLDLPRAVEMAARQTNKKTGVSMRSVAQYDVVNDLFVYRSDIFFGWVAPRKDWSCRVAG